MRRLNLKTLALYTSLSMTTSNLTHTDVHTCAKFDPHPNSRSTLSEGITKTQESHSDVIPTGCYASGFAGYRGPRTIISGRSLQMGYGWTKTPRWRSRSGFSNETAITGARWNYYLLSGKNVFHGADPASLIDRSPFFADLLHPSSAGASNSDRFRVRFASSSSSLYSSLYASHSSDSGFQSSSGHSSTGPASSSASLSHPLAYDSKFARPIISTFPSLAVTGPCFLDQFEEQEPPHADSYSSTYSSTAKVRGGSYSSSCDNPSYKSVLQTVKFPSYDSPVALGSLTIDSEESELPPNSPPFVPSVSFSISPSPISSLPIVFASASLPVEEEPEFPSSIVPSLVPTPCSQSPVASFSEPFSIFPTQEKSDSVSSASITVVSVPSSAALSRSSKPSKIEESGSDLGSKSPLLLSLSAKAAAVVLALGVSTVASGISHASSRSMPARSSEPISLYHVLSSSPIPSARLHMAAAGISLPPDDNK